MTRDLSYGSRPNCQNERPDPELRLVKKTVTVTGSGRKKWNKDLFFEDVKGKMKDPEVQTLRKIYDYAISNGFEIIWGTGVQNGSMNLKFRSINPRSIFTFWASGNFQMNYGWIEGTPEAEKFRDQLKEGMERQLHLKFPEDCNKKWPSFPISVLIPKIDLFLEIIGELAKEYAA